jgi:hypothetical protein
MDFSPFELVDFLTYLGAISGYDELRMSYVYTLHTYRIGTFKPF